MRTTTRAGATATMCLGLAVLLPGCASTGSPERPVAHGAPAAVGGDACWGTPRGVAAGIGSGAAVALVAAFVPVTGVQAWLIDRAAHAGCRRAAAARPAGGEGTSRHPALVMRGERDGAEDRVALLR